MTSSLRVTRGGKLADPALMSGTGYRLNPAAACAAGYAHPVIVSASVYRHVIERPDVDIHDADGRFWDLLTTARRATHAAESDGAAHRFIHRVPHDADSGLGPCALALVVTIARLSGSDAECVYLDTHPGEPE